MSQAHQPIAFILHGKLQKTSIVEEIRRVFAGKDISLHYTAARGDAMKAAQSCLEQGRVTLVAVGGDGTAHEVVNGVMHCSPELQQKACIALLPAGSGNDFARTIGVHNNVKELLSLIERHSLRDCDVLHLFCQHAQDGRQSFYCINVADTGLGGLVAQIVNNSPLWMNADIKYMLGIIRGFFQFRKQYVQLRYESEGKQQHWEGRCMSICMANGIYFGSGIGIAPSARIDDGNAELTIIGDVSLWDYLRNLPRLRKAEQLQHPHIYYRSAQRCHIESAKPFPIEIDGEFAGTTPLDMEVLPHALKVYAP